MKKNRKGINKQRRDMWDRWMEGRTEGKKKAGRQEEEMNKEGRQAGRTEGWREAEKQMARRQGSRDEEGLRVPI